MGPRYWSLELGVLIMGIKDLWNKTIFSDMIQDWKEEKALQREIRKAARKEALVELQGAIKDQYKQDALDRMSGKKKKDLMKKFADNISKVGDNISKNMEKMVEQENGRTFSQQGKKESNNSYEEKIKRMLK
jgi:hypothetical protein